VLVSRISRQIDAYRAGTISLNDLASSLARVRPNPLTFPGAPQEGTWDEVTAAYQTGLLSPADYAALESTRNSAQPSSLPARPTPPPISPPLRASAMPSAPAQRRRHSIFFFVGLALLLLPLLPFVIALDIVIVNFLHFNVLEDLVFMILSLPATYFLEYLFFGSWLPALRLRLALRAR
jgi:hypothetical protein